MCKIIELSKKNCFQYLKHFYIYTPNYLFFLYYKFRTVRFYYICTYVL